MRWTALGAAFWVLTAGADTYLPGEGDIAVDVYQTTGERAFREIPTTPFTVHAYTNRPPIDVDAAVDCGVYSGLGVSLTDASAWIISRLPSERRRALLEAVFSPTKGAALRGVRLNIGASDYSTALYCYDDVPGDVEMRHFSLARDDHWVVPMAKEVQAVNPDVFFFAAPWSPPAWMKTTDNFVDGHFRDGCEPAMANYLAAYVREMDRRGIRIGAVTVQNEAALSTRGTYPSCVFSAEQESRVCKLLAQKLKREGRDTKVWLWDFNTTESVARERLVRQLSDPELLASVDAVAWHSYDQNAEMMRPIKDRWPRLHFYHTEQGPAKHAGNRTQKWWLARIAMMLENGCEAFTGWNLCLTDDGQPLTGPHLCLGLMTVDLDTGNFAESAQYQVFRHIGPFVGKGAHILKANAFDADDCATLLFRNPDGSHVLIVVSDGAGAKGRAGADRHEPRPKLYLKYKNETKHLPLPYGTWSVTTLVFK